MFQLFKMGGPLFMGIQTSVLLVIFLAFGFYLTLILTKNYKDLSLTRSRIKYIRHLGVLAAVLGFLGQMIGLYSAFNAIEKAPDVSPAIIMGGLKVSMITPMYGMIILATSILFWLLCDYLATKKN